MSRYIDADAFLKEYCEPYPHVYMAMSKAVADAPSIDIVRCKECKHYAEHNELYINAPTNCVKHSTINHYVVVNPDDYCSYGERREP